MAINKNHEFEELDGVKCAIVERNATPGRVEFLKRLLEFNGYTVVVANTPPPKAAPAPAVKKPVVDEATEATTEALPTSPPAPEPPLPQTFTVGVTDVTFNPTNAIFGRLLRTPDHHIVTLAYWHQKETVAQDEIPYFQQR
ncbi:MAG TPA: hypothetical protein VFZ78_12685 [Flavisolibacter sp.]